MIFAGVDVTRVDNTAMFGLGEKYAAPNGKMYRYYQYDTGAGSVAAVAGNFAGFYAPGGTSAGATTVITSDVSDSNKVGAGVLQSAPTDGQYCWVQTEGEATLTTALVAGADGNALTLVGSNDGTLDVSAAVTDHIAAIAIDASAKIVYITCP